ncbi:hypothetical protein [Mucilaginibacter sp.]
MKYAFIFGTSAFIVPHGVITVADEDNAKDILSVRSVIKDTDPDSFFSIDLDISDAHGNYIRLTGSKPESEGSYKVTQERNSVKVLNADGSLLIQVHQLDEDVAMNLEHNITAEFEVNMPLTFIRINGDFMAEGIHVVSENEKLWVNEDSWATSALAGKSNLRFTADGVVL